MLVIKKLELLKYKCEVPTKPIIDYDILVTHPKHFTIEVKNDIYANLSGNIALEIWNTKKNTPSGITATKADIWCHIICGEAYIILTTNLKKFLHENQPKKVVEKAGDNNAMIYLYDAELFKTYCLKLDEIGKLI